MCEQNNNTEVEKQLLDLSRNLQEAFKALDASSTKACMVQMQQKRFDLDILDAEAIKVRKLSSELFAYSFKITSILKKLSATRSLWVNLNGITKEQAEELDKKLDESRKNAEKELESNLEEIFNG